MQSAVGRICREKESRGTRPAHASSIEVARLLGCGVTDVEEPAIGLAAAGGIERRRGLNYDFYELKK